MKKYYPKKTIISFVLVYLLSAGAAFGVFNATDSASSSSLLNPSGDSSSAGPDGNVVVNPGEPKTETCPINGLKYTATEKNLWESRRPVLAMIENSVESRPQSGLSSADVVYEAVAEGGITRFMGVFYCDAAAAAGKVAPVRSARIYFVNTAPEYNEPIYVHVGGGNCSMDQGTKQCTSNKKAWALEKLADIGWRKPKGNDFDTTSDIGVPSMYRDYNRLGPDVKLATEHTYVGSLNEIWKEASRRSYAGTMADGSAWLKSFRQWKFAENTPAGTAATDITFDFWKGYKDFTVNWVFDSSNGVYNRNTGGKPHTDLENKKQLAAKTVIVQYVTEEGPLDVHKHMYYEVVGTGKGIIFSDGIARDITWKKSSIKDRTIFSDASGKEITFAPGKIWIELVAKNTNIDYN